MAGSPCVLIPFSVGRSSYLQVSEVPDRRAGRGAKCHRLKSFHLRKSARKASQRERIFDLFRRWGYLQADLDPLGHFPRLDYPELRISGPDAERAREIYCGTIGAEFMHIPDLERRQWIIDRLEGPQAEVDREAILKQLLEADIFEQMLQTLYIGTKRFSLEGNTALIPMMEEILRGAAAHGAEECVMAMSHRGRLAAVCNTVGRTATDIYAGFEDVDPRSTLGGGDVKYHQGATGFREFNGQRMRIHLVSNPSHLEAVDPVALGRVRAKQTRRGAEGKRQTLPVLMHGDSAFAGQGIWAETLNMSYLQAYDVGGTINIIVNNLLGFTTNPSEYASGRFASDLAKRLPIPIFHVNAEDPEAVVRIGRLALEYRYQFGSDVVIDLIGYRRHGHSEVDDPTITQPIVYAKIKAHPPLYEIYAKRLGIDVTRPGCRIQAALSAGQGGRQGHDQKAAALQAARLLGRIRRARMVARARGGYRSGAGRAHAPGPEALRISRGLSHSSQGRRTAQAAPGNGAGQTSHRLRHGRGAGLCQPRHQRRSRSG